MRKRLKHVARLQYGSSLRDDARQDGPFEVFGSNGPVGQHDSANMLPPAIVVGRKGSHGKVVWANDGGYCIDTALFIDRRSATADLRYLYYLLQTLHLDEPSKDSAVPGLDRTDAQNKSIANVDLHTQKSIATYLDRETARIDRLIASKTKLVDLLAEKETAAITAAVTRGLDPSVARAPTGLEWLPEAPAHWKVCRLATLMREMNEPGDPDLPVLSVSIHHGISDRELDEEERDRKVSHIEDRTSYKRVRPGYLAYNMMRAWQGAFGVATVDGLVSPAYVVARPSAAVYPAYLEYLLRTPLCIEEMRRVSKGIASFRLRLYWEAFRQIRIPLPGLDEQRAIAEYVAATSAKIAQTKAAVTQSIERLREYRSALITAAVSGEIAVPERAAAAAVTTVDRSRVRVLVGAEIVERHRATKKFGRVKFQKLLYLAQAHAGIDELDGTYLREAAGPLDRDLLDDAERGMAAAELYRADAAANGNGAGVAYIPLAKAGTHRADLPKRLGARMSALTRLIDLMRDFDTRIVEAITTLYAVWNDALIEGREVDDAAVIDGVLNDWHPEKKDKFQDANLEHWLDWMRRNGLVPKGTGPKTTTGRLFA